ncbi:MAG: MBL fold metallo-hydrolase [Verrucomicrobiaceae bacterium]|nr:MBL fold metallo-hydrolase [Verrucomicrobiaceae bacterium]
MTENSTYTGGIAATNAHLLRLTGGAILVDAPEGTAAWLRGQKARVDVLLLTHQHFDHVMDAAAIQAEHGCRVCAFAPFSRELTLERLVATMSRTSLRVPAFEVDELLEGRDTLEAADETWRLYHVPGHSPDSVCFHLEREQFVFGGDVLFLDGIGRTDFPGGSTSLLLSGIAEKLLPLPDATRVFPGHGDDTTIGRERLENPFLN